jgi:hypothetical protein
LDLCQGVGHLGGCGDVYGVVWCVSALTVECYAGDVASMTVEGQDGVEICRLDVVELDRVMAGGGEVAFARRDTQAVDLRIWVRRRRARPSSRVV